MMRSASLSTVMQAACVGSPVGGSAATCRDGRLAWR